MRLLLALTLIAGFASPAYGDQGADDPLMSGQKSGARAVQALGPNLAAAAEINGLEVGEFKELLQTDSTAWVDSTGRVSFREEIPAPNPKPAAVPSAPYPLADTFNLHSLPGAQRTIALHFGTRTIANSIWNTESDVPAKSYDGYDTDGNPGSFSDTEKAEIQEVWRRVAEDFAPFAVNVTTAPVTENQITRTNASDQVFGTTAFITNDLELPQLTCSDLCAGIAYINVFDTTWKHSFTQPALVFASKIYDTAYLAETVSHEVGHNLSLNHDDTSTFDYYQGHGGWAPIMGSPAYPISQWSRGDYVGATNQEDDISQIATHGAPLRTDDFTAGPGLDTNPAASRTGVIGHAADIDMVNVGVCSGQSTISAKSEGNLDIELTLVDPAGNTVESANPISAGSQSADYATGLDASITTSLPHGRYFAKIDGVGRGSWAQGGYDDYGSIGQWTLTTTCDVSPMPLAPSAVRHLAVEVDHVNRSATLTWLEPGELGSEPTVEYEALLDGEPISFTETADGATATLQNLVREQTHQVSVVAKNSVGSSPAAELSFAVASFPVPKNLSAKAGDGQVDLAWDSPTGFVYLAGWRVQIGEYTQDLPGSARSVRLSRTADLALKNGTSYVATVTALIDGEVGPATAAATVSFRPSGVPGRPGIGRATSGAKGGKSQATARWSTAATNGATILGYQVFAQRLAGSRVTKTYSSKVLSSHSRSFTMTLPKGNYRFVVRAKNANGWSPLSSRSAKVSAR